MTRKAYIAGKVGFGGDAVWYLGDLAFKSTTALSNLGGLLSEWKTNAPVSASG